MFHYVLAFLLINTYYQSLGNPIQPSPASNLLSKQLTTLANQCENPVLAKNLKSAIQECSVFAPPYNKKQSQCLIFYDINMQLCSVSSKLSLNENSLSKINDKQDVNILCTLAKDWVFTNISDFAEYKEKTEKLMKMPATCGEVCGLEDPMNEANYFCKYYKWGLEILKSQVATMANSNTNNNAVAAPIMLVPDVNMKPEIPVHSNSDPLRQEGNTKTLNGQIKQTEPTVPKTIPRKVVEADNEVVKPDTTVQATLRQTPSFDGSDADKNDDSDVNVRLVDPPAVLPDSVAPNIDQANKSTVVNALKPTVSNIIPESGKDLPVNADPKEAVLEHPKQKPMGDTDDYADSDVNENIDDEGEEQPGLEIKSDQDANHNTFVGNKLVVPAHEVDNSQKEYFPNAIPDGFSEDSDHFFPFFMTAIILMVLLYILYHNKNKVSKVFFGLLLEGRQNGRRRNSRGHSYRRLDTLEQAMSANTAAPPSKIIY